MERFVSISRIVIVAALVASACRKPSSTSQDLEAASVERSKSALLVAVDGTWLKYDSNSVVSRLHQQWKAKNAGEAIYHAGVQDGIGAADAPSIARELFDGLCASESAARAGRVYFAGYSRGVLIVLHVADRLRKECESWRQKSIHFFLVDGVDHSLPWTDAEGKYWPRELPRGTTGTHFVKTENYGAEDPTIYATREIAGCIVHPIFRHGRPAEFPNAKNAHTYIAFMDWSVAEIFTDIRTQCVLDGVGRCLP